VALGEVELTNDTIIDLQLSFGDWEGLHSILLKYMEDHPEKYTQDGMFVRRLEHTINRYLDFTSEQLF
tara:strand:+ start:113 stop:316 length:204 start_codon:yes stop_codon:yes gene_type:complete